MNNKTTKNEMKRPLALAGLLISASNMKHAMQLLRGTLVLPTGAARSVHLKDGTDNALG